MPTLQEIRQQYPQYNDLSDADLSDRLYKSFYADMPRAEFNKRMGLEVDPAGINPPPPSAADQIGRSLGIGTRAVAQGLAAPVTMIGDAVNSGLRALGVPIGSVSGQLGAGLDALGLPKPETGSERVMSRVAESGAGAMTFPMAGGAMAQGSSPLVQALGKTLAMAPGTQIGAGVGAGLGSGLAAELPIESPGWKGAAELAGGLVGGAAGALGVEGAKYLARTSRSMVLPWTQSGREELAADVLRRTASNPRDLPDALRAGAGELVPGSQPTTAQASGDPGLYIAERGFQRANPKTGGEFAMRRAEQNRAWNQELDALVPEPSLSADAAGRKIRSVMAAGKEGAENALAAQTGPLYERALSNPTPVDGRAVIGYVDERLQEVKGPIATALNQAKSLLLKADASGPEDKIAGLHASRRALNELIGRQRMEGLGKEGKRELLAVRAMIDDVIAAADPNYEQARALTETGKRAIEGTYELGSAGKALARDRFNQQYMLPDEKVASTLASGQIADIEQFLKAAGNKPEAVQTLRRAVVDRLRARVETADPSALGEAMISPAKFRDFVNSNREMMTRLYDESHLRMLDRIGQDMERVYRSVRSGAPGGSDTFQNVATTSIVDQITGRLTGPQSVLNPTAGRVLNWLYKVPEEKLQGVLEQAFLDPNYARLLLMRATPRNLDALRDALTRVPAPVGANTAVHQLRARDEKSRP